jgi:hypothetical protein
MIAKKEKCADKDKSVCEYNDFTRLRYFHGMLLDENDFKAEQNYHNAKRRFLNRMLHGSGVVCGLELHGEKGGAAIEITTGFALDCSGNEIWVPQNKLIDLVSLLPPKVKDKDQECIEEEPAQPNTYYVGIRYQEKPSNPVAVYLPSGGCDERTCENSRVKEGYCVEIVPCCIEKREYPELIKLLCGCGPDFVPGENDKPPLCSTCAEEGDAEKKCRCMKMEEFCERSVPCPECSCETSCFVVLGQIEVNDKNRLESICLNECRRYVLTPHLLQHLLRAIMVGAAGENGYLKMELEGKKIPLPDSAKQWVDNPLKALCWWLPYAAVDKGQIKFQGCPTVAEEEEEETLTLEQVENSFRKLEGQFLMLKNRPVAQPGPLTSPPTPPGPVRSEMPPAALEQSPPQAPAEPEKSSTPKGKTK